MRGTIGNPKCDSGIRCKGVCISSTYECRTILPQSTSKVIAFARKKLTENRIDAAVGIVSTGASFAGGAAFGLAGAKAAEFAASLAVRKGARDMETTYASYSKIKQTERFKTASRFDKAKMVLEDAYDEASKNENRKFRRKDLIAESVGFVTGNIGATLPISVPMRGMFIAILATPQIMKAIDNKIDSLL